jgi:hypothetical protein
MGKSLAVALALVTVACAHIRVMWNDGSGAVRLDRDGDGFAGPWECQPGYPNCNAEELNKRPEKLANLDCNDRDATIHPGAVDTPGDGIDQNCDGADGVRAGYDQLRVPGVTPAPQPQPALTTD